MIAQIVFLVIGLAGLVVCAEFFVKGAVSIARRFHMPDILIGATIVAIGTSAPELVINMFAAVEGEGDIVLSNIIGSNIVNICLGLGVAAQFAPIHYNRRAARVDLPLGLLGSLLLFLCFVPDADSPVLHRVLGIALLAGFVGYLIMAKSEPVEPESDGHLGMGRTIVYLLLAAGGLAWCGDVVVDSAVLLADAVGIPKSVIGATIIAAGGSLPEVATCFAAARQGRPQIALGNIAGSQIFNIFGILGLSSIVARVSFSTFLAVDFLILVALTVVLLAFVGRHQGQIGRAAGIGFIVAYLAYLGYQAVLALGG